MLTDKTHDEIATAMNDPSSDIAKGAIGTANAITATICKITGDKPTKVCSVSAVKSIEGQLRTVCATASNAAVCADRLIALGTSVP